MWYSIRACLIKFSVLFVLLAIANFAYSQCTATFAKTDVTCFGGTNGAITMTASGGTGTYEYKLATTGAYQTSPTFSNLPAGTYTVTVKDDGSCINDYPVTIGQPASALAASALTTPTATCSVLSLGSATILASGGTPRDNILFPYEYKLGDGVYQDLNIFGSLAAGYYIVTVKDKLGCTKDVPVIITQLLSTVNVAVDSKVDVPCSGGNVGSINVSGSGGAGPYEYKIGEGAYQSNQTFDNLGVGTYTITAKDANGCIDVVTTQITQAASTITATATPTMVTCFGSANGSIAVAASGGTGTLEYKIGAAGIYQTTPTFSNLAPGTYTVTVKDASGCTKDATPVTITQPATALSGNISNQVNISCVTTTGSATVTGTGGTTPYSYSLDGGAYLPSGAYTSLTAGAHPVTIRDANLCTQAVTITITQTPNTIVATATPTMVTCFGSANGSIAVTASGGTGTLEYKIGAAGSYQTSSTFSNLGPGSYNITVKDANGCTTDATPVTITQPAAAVTITETTHADITCLAATGSVTVAGAGGAGSYEYKLGAAGAYQTNPTFNDLPAGPYIITVRDANNCTAEVSGTITQAPNTIVATATPTMVTCFGSANGSIAVTASGGTGTLEYKIGVAGIYQTTPTFSNLGPGSYTITVKDANSCTRDATPVTITQPAAAVTITETTHADITCLAATGSVTVAGAGGAGSYEYKLGAAGVYQTNPTFNNLPAGPYIITVRDANNCTAEVSGTITQAPNTIVATATPTMVTCFGSANGSIAVTASGGTGTLEYKIGVAGIYQTTPTFSNLAPGTYTVTVKDASGCTKDATPVTITQPSAALSGNISNQVNISCVTTTGSATVTGTGGTAPYSYSLDGGAYLPSGAYTSLTAGAHPVTIRDANLCTQTVTITITETANTITATATPTMVTCFGSANGSIAVAASGGTGTLEYKIGVAGIYQTTPTFSNLAPGTYTVTVKDASGCTKDATPVTITQPATALSGNISNQINISCAATTGSATVTGTGGTAPYSYSLDGGAYLPSGAYTSLTAGAHPVTIRDANLCTQAVTITITQTPNTIVATATPTMVTCFGSANGSIAVAASGGTGTLEYKIGAAGIYQTTPTFSNLAPGTYTVTVKDASGCTKDATPVTITQPSAALSGNISNQVNISCVTTTGSATVTGTGGTAPYSYSLDGGAYLPSGAYTSLTAGAHPVTIRDANLCTQAVTITITQTPNTIVATATPTMVTCFGSANGSIAVTASGGTGTLEYKIGVAGIYQTTPTFSNLAPGTYTVTVKDASGCTKDAIPVTITQPAAVLTATVGSQTPIPCSGGTASATIAGGGGTAPYTYSLAGGAFVSTATFTGLTLGNHIVTVKDAGGCTKDVTVVITQASNTITASLVSKTDIPCSGGTATAIVSGSGGTAPYTYSIDNVTFQPGGTFNNLTAGDHTITVKDAGGCTKSLTVTIIQVSNTVNGTVTSKTDITCTGGNIGTVTVAGSGGTGSYTYKLGNGAYQPSGQFTNLAADDYIVTVRDAAGCTKDITVKIVQLPNSVTATIVSKTDIPCSGGNTGSVTVAGGGGTAPYTFRISGGYQSNPTFSNLASGDHIVTVRDAAGCTKEVTVNIAQVVNTVTATVSSKTDVSCVGGSTGSITVSGGGGTGPYEYKIGSSLTYQSTGLFSGLGAGGYTITVKDAGGCTRDVTVTLVQLPNTVTAVVSSKTDITCFGGNTGSVTVAGGGGTAPYMYSLSGGIFLASPTFTNLPTGDHVITVRDAAGCTKAVTATIVQIANTVTASVVSKVDVSCAGGNTGSVTVAGGGGTAPYSYRIGSSAFQPNATFTNLAVGDYTVTVQDAGGCTKDVPVSIVQLPNTVVATIVSKTDIPCSGSFGSVTVLGTGGTAPYEYKLGNGAYQPGGTFIVLGTGNYTITVRDALGCTRDIVANIVQTSSTVTVSVISKSEVPCSGGNIGTLTVLAGGGTAPYSYKIDVFPYQSTPTFNGLGAGDHVVAVRDAFGCTKEVIVNIAQLNNTVTATVNAKTDVPCSGGNVGAITVTGGGGTAPYTYKLGAGLYQETGSFTNLPVGDHTVTVRDLVGCTRDVTVNIAQLANTVTATVNKIDVSCAGGNSGSVTVSGVAGTAPYEYKLDAGAYQASGVFGGLAIGHYVITVKDAGGCTKDIPLDIVQLNNTATAAVASKIDVPCTGGSVGSVTVAGSGGTAPYEYKLGTGLYQSSGTFSGLAGGNYLVTVKDAGGCTKDLAVVVGQLPNTVTAAVSSKSDIPCSGGTGTVTVTGNGGTAPYEYKLGTGAYQASATFTNLPAGDHIVTVKDAAGCTKDISVSIAQLPNTVTADVTDKTEIPCSGGNVGAVTVTGGGGTAPYQYSLGGAAFQTSGTFSNLSLGNYLITVKDANGCVKDLAVIIGQSDNTVTAAVSSNIDVPCSGGNSGSITAAGGGGTAPYMYSLNSGTYQASPIFGNLAAGDYIVTVRDANGCTKDVTATVSQLNNTVTAAIASKTDVPCAGGNIGSVTITAGGGTAPYMYKLGPGAYQTSVTFTGLAAGDYTVTVKDAVGCTRDVAVNIGQLDNTVIATVSSKTDITCNSGNTGSVTVAGGGGTAPYTYKLGIGAYQTSATFDKLAAGDYTITVKDAAGCTRDVTVNIASGGSAAAGTISPATVDAVCTGTSQTLTASAGVSFQWFLNDVVIVGATAQTYNVTEAGRYTATISNGTCSTKATNTVTITFKSCTETEVFVPKAFTPNNNNKNDKLTPRFINVKEFRYFRIYNRWGQLIYQTNVNGEGWDGMFKGVRQPMETYNWIVECVDDNGKPIRKSGKTILIR